ncbi:ORF6N domain-containing protein [Elusimicrobiota bacterium]
MTNPKSLIAIETIEKRIYLIRGCRVMLDSDLADLYSVSTGRLNEQVRRNIRRFPVDFMFQLDRQEFSGLMSQVAISKKGRGGRRKLPLVFTQEGVAMLSGILRSCRAIETNISIIRAFVRLREMISTHGDLAARLDKLERDGLGHGADIRTLFDAIHELMAPPDRSKSRIGFRTKPE